MNDAKQLLEKIASLRLRLDQAQGMAQGMTAAAQALTNQAKDAAALEAKVERGNWHNTLIDSALRSAEAGEKPALPSRLTLRGARLVQRARDLLQELKALAEDPILERDERDPLAALHRPRAGLIADVQRTVQGFPP